MPKSDDIPPAMDPRGVEDAVRDDLIAFEDAIAEEFNAGRIPYPIHLTSGNEDQLIEIFRDIKPEDWVFGSWRMHYHALLKGVSPESLRAAIHRGESMTLRFDTERVYGSAIVGGTVPIALGVAMAIKRCGGDEVVWCFVGDMTAHAGIFLECLHYVRAHNLPLQLVIEDNRVSVCTSTYEVWGSSPPLPWLGVRHYEYRSKYPHAGAGVRVQF